MRSSNKSYHNISESGHEKREGTPWYWRLIALAASWMILGGYLILPGLYRETYELKFSRAVLSVFVVALLTAGYSFTALLCFACRNERFQADGVFLPALTSSALGLISIAYNFVSSPNYHWGNAAISGTVISAAGTILYSSLLLWTYRRIVKSKRQTDTRQNLWSDQNYYNNFIPNMYPTAMRSPSQPPAALYSEDDRVNQQMALLLKSGDPRPSPDVNTTFRIDLPEDREQQARHQHSQELVGTPAQTHGDWGRDRSDSRPDSLSEQWTQYGRGRSENRPSSTEGRGSHSRNLSREERRREIELGQIRV